MIKKITIETSLYANVMCQNLRIVDKTFVLFIDIFAQGFVCYKNTLLFSTVLFTIRSSGIEQTIYWRIIYYMSWTTTCMMKYNFSSNNVTANGDHFLSQQQIRLSESKQTEGFILKKLIILQMVKGQYVGIPQIRNRFPCHFQFTCIVKNSGIYSVYRKRYSKSHTEGWKKLYKYL